jgi:tRNA A-37 threonylcarbamoyl transferase component Bud32
MTASLLPGTLLADTYRVVRQVGAGGMGAVYEATHSRLPGRYAIKVLQAEVTNRADVFLRFRREAEVTSALRHPNIVQVIDFNQTPDGSPYLVMEFLDGTELADEIARVGAMPLARVVDIVGQAASALTAAHHHNIIHRDLKPQNMFLVRLAGEDREVVKVVDFGISKVREATTRLTQESTVMGTPQYMAPEQAMGRQAEIDARTDEFALASITYELLTGRTPFQGETVHAILYQVVHETPPPMRDLVPAVNAEVEAVVLKALSKSRDARYPTVLAFHQDLVRAAALDQRLAAMGLAETLPAASQPGAVPAVASATTLRLAAGSVGSKPPGLRQGRRWLLPVAVAAGVTLSAWGVLMLRSRQLSNSPLPRGPTSSVAGVRPEPPTVGALRGRPFSTVDVEDGPAGLRVTVDGVTKSLPIELPRGPATHTLRFEAPGYEPRELRIDGVPEHRSLVLEMKPTIAGQRAVVTDKQSPGAPPPRPSRRRARVAPTVTGRTPPTPPPAEAPSTTPSKQGLILDF